MRIRAMNMKDIERVANHFCPSWSTVRETTRRWKKYYEEQQKNIRIVGVAEKNKEVLGFGSLLRKSEYPHFSNIPEICDVWIYEKHRRQGIGKQLMAWLEAIARQEGCKQIGLGVGLYPDYGPAQQLYFHLGYRPDGRGITYKCKTAAFGEKYRIDDDLVLWMVKAL